MHGVERTLVALAALLTVGARAQTEYVLTKFPLSAVSPDSSIKMVWTGAARPGYDAPDSGYVYYSKVPLGQSLKGRNRVKVMGSHSNEALPGTPDQRELTFVPSDQEDMEVGVFYYVVAWPHQGVPGIMDPDTFYSNELELVVESTEPTKLKTPSGEIEDLTPTFSWDVNSGVPYYHVILSDEEIAVDSGDGGGELSIEGLSIVWQAITPSTQIVYGAPDPSGTITASPPPLSTGQTYSVVVLNNYGNHPAYTSTRFGLPRTFSIAPSEDTLKPPVNVSPVDKTLSGDEVVFRWTNLDSLANTYKIYVYVASNIENVDAQMVVWDNEVTAGSFSGDTASVAVNASAVLTENHYTWKVVAVDERGAGRAGDTTSFDYESPTGTLKILTRENIYVGGEKVDEVAVSAVELQVEVLEGSLEKPLLFYTDNNGYLSRERPEGTYRVTAVKKGFESVSKTLEVKDDKTTSATMYLRRPDATVFGKVVNESGQGINLATVTAVSDKGDTVEAETDVLGSFTLTCYKGDWEVWARKSGYIASLSSDTSVSFGESVNFGTIELEKVPYTISGTVKNQKGQPLIGVKVELLLDGKVIETVPSTSQDGSFSFSVEAGDYRLVATKTGFVTYRKDIEVSSSVQRAVTLSSNASMAVGYIYGRSVVRGEQVVAPITGATVYFVDEDGDTATVLSDPVYGDYRISLPAGRYSFWGGADDHVAPEVSAAADTTLKAGVTYTLNDTLQGLATLRGAVLEEDEETNRIVGAVDGVSVSLLSTGSNKVVGSATTQYDGTFEIRGICDGEFYVQAGKEGLVTDSVGPKDTLEIDGGAPEYDSLTVFMVPGTKTISWSVRYAGRKAPATIKVLSPLEKVLNADSSLSNVGAGAYVVTVDAEEDSLLDLSYHPFTVEDDAEESHAEKVTLRVSHAAPESLDVDTADDKVRLVLSSGVTLDSAVLFYRALSATSFRSVGNGTDTTDYVFRVMPPRDGSHLVYYFVAYHGDDVYGYGSETYRTYVRPNPKISKLEIVPGNNDTLLMPPGYTAVFRLKAFYGSTYLPYTGLTSQDVVWSWKNEPKDATMAFLEDEIGVSVVTGSKTGRSPISLSVTVDSARVRTGASNRATAWIEVASAALDSIRVLRTDPGAPDPISTATGERAEFAAEGLSEDDDVFTLTARWKISPSNAGSISSNGVFTPAKHFVGRVQVAAEAEVSGGGVITNEYNVNRSDPSLSGLVVQHIVVDKDTPDTMTNNNGLRVVLPAHAVDPNETGLLDLSEPRITNLVERGLKGSGVVGTVFDIKEVNGVKLPAGENDSITLVLDIPRENRDRARSSASSFMVGHWNEDSLQWEVVESGRMIEEKGEMKMTASVAHFSRYAVLMKAGELEADLRVTPNPFSPYRMPAGETRRGTRIRFTAATKCTRVDNVKVHIYNVLGDLVWGVEAKSVEPNAPREVWWNGRTTDGEMTLEDWVAEGSDAGERMCRNGRYIVVLSVRDCKDKVRRYKKQIILIK